MGAVLPLSIHHSLFEASLLLCSQIVIVFRGMESIREVEKYSAPLLVALSLTLLVWAVSTAGGFGPMLSSPSQVV